MIFLNLSKTENQKEHFAISPKQTDMPFFLHTNYNAVNKNK